MFTVDSPYAFDRSEGQACDSVYGPVACSWYTCTPDAPVPISSHCSGHNTLSDRDRERQSCNYWSQTVIYSQNSSRWEDLYCLGKKELKSIQVFEKWISTFDRHIDKISKKSK